MAIAEVKHKRRRSSLGISGSSLHIFSVKTEFFDLMSKKIRVVQTCYAGSKGKVWMENSISFPLANCVMGESYMIKYVKLLCGLKWHK